MEGMLLQIPWGNSWTGRFPIIFANSQRQGGGIFQLLADQEVVIGGAGKRKRGIKVDILEKGQEQL